MLDFQLQTTPLPSFNFLVRHLIKKKYYEKYSLVYSFKFYSRTIPWYQPYLFPLEYSRASIADKQTHATPPHLHFKEHGLIYGLQNHLTLLTKCPTFYCNESKQSASQ